MIRSYWDSSEAGLAALGWAAGAITILMSTWVIVGSLSQPPSLSPPVATQHQETSCPHNL
jgi:hypothetical protein